MRQGRLLPLLAALPAWGQFVGSGACVKCHPAAHPQAIHQISQTVAGDFTQAKLTLHGAPYLLERGGPFITESEISGKPVKYKVDHVLGGKRIEQYLTTLADGRMMLLSPSWDVLRKQWIHDLDVENPQESNEDAVQVWNKSCYSCHVSGGQKNFDASQGKYHSTWRAPGVDCESCHGPGKAHLTGGPIVNPAKLDAARSVAVCAQCHSSRDIYASGFEAGRDYNDSFSPVLEYRSSPGDFWLDGRPRSFANEATAFMQSQCFLTGGATCVTCHTGANVRDSCAGCHPSMSSQHSQHSAKVTCLDCHMPYETGGLRAKMRDHSLSVPTPENTVRLGVPNACGSCHAGQQLVRSGSKKMMLRAAAFDSARKHDPAAIPLLLQVLSDRSMGGWIRANAAGYLGTYSDDPTSYAAIEQAFADADPLVRSSAAVAIHPRGAQREAAAAQLVKLLSDPVLSVRLNAGIGLVSMGVRPFPGDDGLRFEEAKRLYQARAELNNDQPQQVFAAGKFLFLSGDMEAAAKAFRSAMKLDAKIPAQYLLARALAGKGDYNAARQIVKSMPREDPQYMQAQRLLAEIDAQTAGLTPGKERFQEGSVQYQARYYGAALKELDEALRLEPKSVWAAQARAYRAICLAKLARPKEAEAAIVAALPNAPADVDLRLAYVELLQESGRATEAEQQIGQLLQNVANAPNVHFWHAKLLLQSHKNEEAARAAEEAIRLQPQYPEARNLLIRIYQALGRTKEAAQQAEWLREYQRSH